MDSKRFFRRNLLKGALAAPAVFSVRTASAQAEYVRVCVAQGAAQAAVRRPAALSSSTADEWLRIPVDVYRLSVYQGAELKPLDGKFILGVDKARYWKINDSTRSTMAAPTSHVVGKCVATKTGEVKQALVYVDNSGNAVGFAFEPRNGVAALESCLAAYFNPAGII